MYAWVDTFLMTLNGPIFWWLSLADGHSVLIFSVFSQTIVPAGQSGIGSHLTLVNFW